MDYKIAHANMVEQQIRTWNVLQTKTLNAFSTIRREDFVGKNYLDLAYADIKIPLAHNEVMLEPKTDARIIQALNLDPNDQVLEIGTGSGYLTAILASLSQHITSIDIHPDLSQKAEQNLATTGITNVTLEVGDAHNGWSHNHSYDAIIISGSLPICPNAYLTSLSENGRMVAIIGNPPTMQVVLYQKYSDQIKSSELFETHVPRLKNAPETSLFVF